VCVCMCLDKKNVTKIYCEKENVSVLDVPNFKFN